MNDLDKEDSVTRGHDFRSGRADDCRPAFEQIDLTLLKWRKERNDIILASFLRARKDYPSSADAVFLQSRSVSSKSAATRARSDVISIDLPHSWPPTCRFKSGIDFGRLFAVPGAYSMLQP